jgi:hypothetical protein
MSDRPIFTYQTRLASDEGLFSALAAYAALYGHIERCLFARMEKGERASSFKNEFLQEFKITARQFSRRAGRKSGFGCPTKTEN